MTVFQEVNIRTSTFLIVNAGAAFAEAIDIWARDADGRDVQEPVRVAAALGRVSASMQSS